MVGQAVSPVSPACGRFFHGFLRANWFPEPAILPLTF
jgi:hypothetical protein